MGGKIRFLRLYCLILGFWPANWCGKGSQQVSIRFFEKEILAWAIVGSFEKLSTDCVTKGFLKKLFKVHEQKLRHLGLSLHQAADIRVFLRDVYDDRMVFLDEAYPVEPAEESGDGCCPICAEEDYGGQKIVLPCSQSLCKKCLKVLILRSFACPFCRRCDMSKVGKRVSE